VAISSRTRIFIVSVVAVVAGAAALLSNLEKIQNYFRPEPVPPTVRPISAKLSNTGENEVSVAGRGDFMLWLPGPEARHTTGKYEFHNADGNFPVFAHILNQNVFGRVLEQGDCDISLIVGREGRGIKFTDNLPFTKSAIEKYYVSVDVGAAD
jgi:hypothetical protein